MSDNPAYLPDGAMRAGLDGLHKNDCWDAVDHEDCLAIVSDVLDGLADGGYRVVRNAD